MKRRTNKKKKIVYLLLIVLLTLTVGYAVVMTNLRLIGYTTVTRKAWGIYWDNVQLTEGSSPNTEPSIGKIGKDPEKSNITFTATLNDLDAFYEFTVDAVNESDVDAMITGVTKTSSPTLPAYIKYSVTYDDGVEIANNHIIRAAKNSQTPTIETYKVRVYFDKTSLTNDLINSMPESQTYTLTFEVTYAKATAAAIEREYHIASCPGCAFKYDADTTYNFNNYNNQQISTFTNYTTDYRQLKVSYYVDNYGNTCDPESSNNCRTVTYQRTVFMGSQLDSNDKIKKAYICGIHKGKAFCLEEDITRQTTGNKSYERNIEVLKQVYDFNNDCSEYNSSDYSLYCGSSSNTGEAGVTIEDYYDGRNMQISSYTGGHFRCTINYEGHMYCTEHDY